MRDRDDRSGPAPTPEQARHFVDGVNALGLGGTLRVEATGATLRLALEPADVGPGARRWGAIAHAIEVLADASLRRSGITEPRVEVLLTDAGWKKPELPHDSGLAGASRSLAQKAVALGKSFAIGPMSVPDRRLVHQAIGEVGTVWTRSEGEGIARRLWVTPRVKRQETPAPEANPAKPE